MQLIILVVVKIDYIFFPNRYFFLASSFSTSSFRCCKSEGEMSLSRHVSWSGQKSHALQRLSVPV